MFCIDFLLCVHIFLVKRKVEILKSEARSTLNVPLNIIFYRILI